jgi:hypothetical protein
METSVNVILKKTFSIALIFNSLISIATVAGITYAFYTSSWHPYAPYLISGNVLWLVLAAGIINIFPSASLGRALHTGRFLFHHYVYGFSVVAITSVLVVAFTPVSPINLFFVNSDDIPVNAGRFFTLAGLALLLDDLPDVSKRLESSLNWVKTKACRVKMGLHVAQFITGIFAIYGSISILLSTIFVDSSRALPNSFVIVSLFITGITSFALVQRKAWLTITPPEQKPKLFV